MTYAHASADHDDRRRLCKTTSGYRDMLARLGSNPAPNVAHVAVARAMRDHLVLKCAGGELHESGGYRDEGGAWSVRVAKDTAVQVDRDLGSVFSGIDRGAVPNASKLTVVAPQAGRDRDELTVVAAGTGRRLYRSALPAGR